MDESTEHSLFHKTKLMWLSYEGAMRGKNFPGIWGDRITKIQFCNWKHCFY